MTRSDPPTYLPTEHVTPNPRILLAFQFDQLTQNTTVHWSITSRRTIHRRRLHDRRGLTRYRTVYYHRFSCSRFTFNRWTCHGHRRLHDWLLSNRCRRCRCRLHWCWRDVAGGHFACHRCIGTRFHNSRFFVQERFRPLSVGPALQSTQKGHR